jgi:hypothetical protein
MFNHVRSISGYGWCSLFSFPLQWWKMINGQWAKITVFNFGWNRHCQAFGWKKWQNFLYRICAYLTWYLCSARIGKWMGWYCIRFACSELLSPHLVLISCKQHRLLCTGCTWSGVIGKLALSKPVKKIFQPFIRKTQFKTTCTLLPLPMAFTVSTAFVRSVCSKDCCQE